jgi:hypothetical protein
MAGSHERVRQVDGGFAPSNASALPGLFTTVVPWLGGAQHKELTREYRYRRLGVRRRRGAGSVTIGERSVHVLYPFTDELDRRHFAKPR